MKPSVWDFWAPLAVVAIGVYRLTTGDPVISVLTIAIGLVCLGAGHLTRHRRC